MARDCPAVVVVELPKRIGCKSHGPLKNSQWMLPSAAPTQIVYWLALFKPAFRVFSSLWKNRTKPPAHCRGTDGPRPQGSRLRLHRIGKVLAARCRRPSAGGHFSHAGHRLRPDASLVRGPADAFRDRCDGRILLINGRSNGCGNCRHFPDDGVDLRDDLRRVAGRRLD